MPPAQEPFPAEPGSQPYPGPSGPPYPTYPGYPDGYPPYQPYGAPPPAPPRTGGVPWWVWLIGGCLGLAIIVGIACVALGLTAGRLFNTLANETPVASTSTQTFTVTSTPSLTIHDTAGQVTVKTGDTKSVIVEITKNARDTSSSAAQNDLNTISVNATQSGNAINVDANFNQAVSPFKQLTVDLVITVPPTANLSLQAEAGDVAIDGVSGRLTATLSAGSLEAHGVTLADGSNVNVSYGNVTLEGSLAAGASVAVTVTAGNAGLTLPASTAAHLDASTSAGGITITGWSIPITHSGASATASGDMGASPSGTLTIHVATGGITLTAGAS
jgi:hypothetical protein